MKTNAIFGGDFICVCRDSKALLVSLFPYSHKWLSKLYFIRFFKKKKKNLCTIFIWFHCYWYFLLQDIYFIKPLERYCCHQQWVQDMVSWARLSLLRDPWHQSSVPVWFGSLAVSHISPQITCETQSFPLQPWLPHLLAPHISACYVWQPLPSCLVV